MLKPTKEKPLYLTIKLGYFDQIVAGTKKDEYRKIKYTTYREYLECDEEGNPYYEEDLTNLDDSCAGDIFMWNNGVYQYVPKDAHQFLSLAVGYAQERDTAIVEIDDITFEPLTNKQGNPARARVDEVTGECIVDDNGQLCLWQIVYHLGEVVEVNRKS